MAIINLHSFLTEFATVWEEVTSTRAQEIIDKYSNNTAWTDFMLGDEGLLEKISNKYNEEDMPVKMKREYYTLDGLYVGGENLFRSDYMYPSDIYALIEHENGNNVEEEMWKLIHWRCPLKVLIFYDWAEDEKKSGKRENWLNDKLETLMDMIEKVDKFNTESNITEYLFLIGSCKDKLSLPYWKWASPCQTRLRDVNKEGALSYAMKVSEEKGMLGKDIEQLLTLEFITTDSHENAICNHGTFERKYSHVIDEVNKIFREMNKPLRLNNVSASQINSGKRENLSNLYK